MNSENSAFLEVKNISKSFSSTKALANVSICFDNGQIHGLIGENGSGKSTLSSIITGALTADAGNIFFKGQPFKPGSIAESRGHGVCMLAQELGTIDGLTVAANMFLGREDMFSLKGTVSIKRMNMEAAKILKESGAGHIAPVEFVDFYSFEERKLIEVASAMYYQPEVLIVDETTTALSQKGRDVIYNIIHKMRDAGKLVILISHELKELKTHCDVVSVLKDGCVAGKLIGDEITESNMRTLMVGRQLQGSYYRDDDYGYRDEVVLSVRNLCREGAVKDVSFDLHRGEILGIGGLSECGMHELCKMIFGALKKDGGEVLVPSSGRKIRKTGDALREHIAYLAKDRDRESVFLNASILDNIAMMSLDQIRKGPYISSRKEKKLAQNNAQLLSIKMRDINQRVKELSGGNKQKVAVAKWLANNSKIFLMDCPTRGIDIGVKQAIYHLMADLKKKGQSIIMVSEELPELIGMSDRILILKDGQISAEFLREQHVDEQTVIQKMI